MDLIEKRVVAQVFIKCIIVTHTEKYRVTDVEIHWQDNSKDEFLLLWSAKTWTLWPPTEMDTLSELIQQQATQEEISAALPKRNWIAIRIQAYEVIRKRSFEFLQNRYAKMRLTLITLNA